MVTWNATMIVRKPQDQQKIKVKKFPDMRSRGKPVMDSFAPLTIEYPIIVHKSFLRCGPQHSYWQGHSYIQTCQVQFQVITAGVQTVSAVNCSASSKCAPLMK